MCTLIVGHRLAPETPLLVGANRDEVLSRPATPPDIRTDGPIPYLAPRDQRAGGTWIGLNAAGVFAAITNRFGPPSDPDRQSRGELVPLALQHDSAAAAAERLERVDATDYNGFHLIVADDESAHVTVGDGALSTTTDLDPGFTVLTERSFGAADNVRKRRVRSALLECDPDDVDLDDLRERLTRCDPGSMDAVCISLDGIDYGTRSSTLIRRGPDETEFHHADGPPCDASYDDISELVAELDAR